jgi:hypothetical protein
MYCKTQTVGAVFVVLTLDESHRTGSWVGRKPAPCLRQSRKRPNTPGGVRNPDSNFNGSGEDPNGK